MARFEIVMAEQNIQDVVTKTQSAGDPSSADVSAAQYFDPAARTASEQSTSVQDSPINSEPTPSVPVELQQSTAAGEKGDETALQETGVRYGSTESASTKLTGRRST